jgi:hypothetical protein
MSNALLNIEFTGFRAVLPPVHPGCQWIAGIIAARFERHHAEPLARNP